MIKIAFTYPERVFGEIQRIEELMSSSVDYLHIRKPNLSEEETGDFIGQIPEVFHARCVIHDHFELTKKFNLAGINLRCSEMDTRKNTPELLQKVNSCSAHAIREIEGLRIIPKYVFLSPVFDSISKPGYRSQFNVAELRNFLRASSQKVIALGGVDDSKISLIQELGFTGYAMLGSIWETERRKIFPQMTQIEGADYTDVVKSDQRDLIDNLRATNQSKIVRT